MIELRKQYFWKGNPNKRICDAVYPQKIWRSLQRKLEEAMNRRMLKKLVKDPNAGPRVQIAAQNALFYIHGVRV